MPPPRPLRPKTGKDIHILVRPGLQVRNAGIQQVSAQEVGLLLDEPLEGGTVIAVLNRSASLTDSRILSARVVSCRPDGHGGWLARCRFSAPLSEHQLKDFA
jgi:hypothetical protein